MKIPTSCQRDVKFEEGDHQLVSNWIKKDCWLWNER